MFPYYRYVNLILILVLLVSLFYLIYNLTFSEGSYKKLIAISESIKHLDYYLSLEKEKNRKLKEVYEELQSNKNQTIEVWSKDFLFMVGKNEVIYLPQREQNNSTHSSWERLDNLLEEK